jgi:hypothetical protein
MNDCLDKAGFRPLKTSGDHRCGLYRATLGLTVKQHLAAIRMLFDWLVTGHVIETNPAHSVRGPRYGRHWRTLVEVTRSGLWHQSCTAKVGPDSMSVVDANQKVFSIYARCPRKCDHPADLMNRTVGDSAFNLRTLPTQVRQP